MSQIRSIQVLRAVAALLVAFGHLQAESVTMAAAASSGYRPILLDLTGAGVDLFFIISGFVMVYASRDLFERAGGGQLFLRRRVARIVPLYWAVTTVFLLTMMVIPHALATAAPTWI
jgi:exopolysaccharide production protein ExoZ